MKDIDIGAHINTCCLVFTNPIVKYIIVPTNQCHGEKKSLHNVLCDERGHSAVTFNIRPGLFRKAAEIIQDFHKHTKLIIVALMPTLYSHLHCMLVNVSV